VHDVTEIQIRRRTTDDLDACESVAKEVHALDGYPSFLGEGTLRDFLQPDDAVGAWVALLDGDVVGHVVLRPTSAPPSAALAATELDLDVDRLAFIARLLVAPRARRRGVAGALLDHAAADARARGHVPVLDVVTRDTGALALYEARGWRRLGSYELTLRNGDALSLAVYAAP
jgi:GNAT superfamily N-acetyltransferase